MNSDSDEQFFKFCGLIFFFFFLCVWGILGDLSSTYPFYKQQGWSLFLWTNLCFPSWRAWAKKAERHLNAVARIHVLLHCNTYDYYHRGHKTGLASRLFQFLRTAAASWGIWMEPRVIPSRDHQWLQPVQQLPGLSCSKPSSVLIPLTGSNPPRGNDLSNALAALWGKPG